MTALSNYLENKILDDLFRATTYTPPTTLYIALFTSAPSDTGPGTEVSGGSYARVAVTSATTAWNGTHGNTTGASSGTNGTISNANAIAFPTPTAAWGSITHFGIFDAASGGNLLIWGALNTAKTVNNGDPAPTFAAGALTVQIDN
jgi:hypothetical protein